ncbi:hypothetical protein [Trujillonella humicola]|uniref:hypothetical protein n=1 Tax=Trujillonella humicola TaxID=3383699 RepID=UPI003906AAEE
MPTARKRTALLALLLAVSPGCTATADEPAPDVSFDEVLGTLDLDEAVGTDARMSSLAARPTGGAVVLLDTGDGGVLVDLLVQDGEPRAGDATPVASSGEVLVTPGGIPLVVGTGATGDTLELVDGPATTSLGAAPEVVAAALTPDGTTLVVAAADRQLIAVDPATGQATATGEVPAGTVTRLAARPDGGVAALLATDDGRGTALLRLDAELRPDGDPVELVPKEATRPADLQVTDDDTVVVTLTTADSGRLLTVTGEEVGLTVDLGRSADSGLDLVVSPDGRYATVPLAALQEEARVATFDLRDGEQVGETVLCDGFGSLGATVLSLDGDILVVTGVCLADGATRAWLLGR